jgi:hypothetical protein
MATTTEVGATLMSLNGLNRPNTYIYLGFSYILFIQTRILEVVRNITEHHSALTRPRFESCSFLVSSGS